MDRGVARHAEDVPAVIVGDDEKDVDPLAGISRNGCGR